MRSSKSIDDLLHFRRCLRRDSLHDPGKAPSNPIAEARTDGASLAAARHLKGFFRWGHEKFWPAWAFIW
jgi:hypothetical protein